MSQIFALKQNLLCIYTKVCEQFERWIPYANFLQLDESVLIPGTGSHPDMHTYLSYQPNFHLHLVLGLEGAANECKTNNNNKKRDKNKKTQPCFMCCLIIKLLMFTSQISDADWGQAETTYNLCEVLFKVHKVR